MSNYNATSSNTSTTSGNANEKPTVGEKLKAAFSTKTAEEIHAENLAKQQEYVDDNNVRAMQQQRTHHNNNTTTSNNNNNNNNQGTTAGGIMNQSQARQPIQQTGETSGQRVSNAFNRLAGNNEYPTDGSHITSGTLAPTATAGTSSTMGGTNTSSGHNVPVHHDAGRQQQSHQLANPDTRGGLGLHSGNNIGTSSSHTTASAPTTTSSSSSSSSHHPSSLAGSTGTGGGTFTKTDASLSVHSVTADALRQIDSQEKEALARAEALKRQDEAKLMESSSAAFATLEAQAEALKQKIEREKMAAEADIASQQSSKIQRTRERAEMEKAAIHQAAVQRRTELEAKSNKLQAEIDELAKLKTEEMLREKPGDLQFQHVSEDTGVIAKLTGAVSHKLGIAEKATVTNAITAGHVEHQPAQVTKTYTQAPTDAQTNTQTYTRQGAYHEIPPKHTANTMASGSSSTMPVQEQQALADSKRNI